MAADPVAHLRADPFAVELRDARWTLDAIDLAVERAAILEHGGRDRRFAEVLAAMEVVRTLPEERIVHAAPPAVVEGA